MMFHIWEKLNNVDGQSILQKRDSSMVDLKQGNEYLESENKI